MLIKEIALLIGAYLLGSIPYMYLLSRAKGIDIAGERDLHIALWRKVGRLEGLSGIIVDISKGAIPVLIGFLCDFRLLIVAFAGIAAVVGQMWPVFQKFNGERGNTTGYGAALVLCLAYQAYFAITFGCSVAIIGMLIRTVPRFFTSGQTINERFGFGGPVSNSMPLGMFIGFGIMPMLSWLSGSPVEITLALLVLFAAVIIRRLTAGLLTDLKMAKTSVRSIIINRLLYDRSYF